MKDFLAGLVTDFSITGIAVCLAGKCFGISITLPQVFGIWLILTLLQLKIGGKWCS